MKIKLISILLTALAVQAASAITVTSFTANSTGPANPDITFAGFLSGPQNNLAGGILSYDGAVVVQSGNNSSGAAPFPTTEGDYLSITTGGIATLSFTTMRNSLGFMWGSIDEYNSVEFFLNNVQVGLFSGTSVVNSPVNANGVQGLNGSAYVRFGNGSFDEVVFTSSDNSFEIDNISVPASGSTIMFLGLGLIGLGAVSRRFKK